jgi:1-aminocyclopropane-1-carboxylate deaminase
MEILNHLNIPSPITKVKTAWSESAGIELHIKRDDLIHPIISGNKWRKLSGVFAHYSSQAYSSLVTYGGAYSNHLVATAASCAAMGLVCKGVIRGEEPKALNPVLIMCKLYGMNLRFVSREAYREINRTEGIQDGVLHVPEGGASKLGTKGCQEILNEIDLTHTNKIFVSCGTGTTISGMSQSLLEVENPPTIYGIQVLKGEGYIAKDIKQEYGITDVVIYDQYHCGGYAKTNGELIELIKEFARETGVLLDPIYTGKMMLAIRKLCENKTIKKGDKILAIHTGGLTGWFGKASEL